MPGLLLACFVLSGASSLVLQVVWMRKLVEIFGSSTLAISTVLATFMGGLALGSWLGGRLADRLPGPPGERGRTLGARAREALGDPLLYYALAEAAVGLSALLVPALIEAYRGLNAWLWAQLGAQPVALALARFVLAAGVLLVPTTAMGATLPLLGRRVVRSLADFELLGRRLGALYAANTAGAVVGAASAGFWLIPLLGVSATNSLAAGLALALAAAIAIVLCLPRRRRPAWRLADLEIPVPDEEAPPPLRLSAADRRLALAAYGISGAVAMALEVFWSRAQAIVIGSSVYTFTLVVVVFLVGISLGAALMARLASRTRRPLALLAWLLAGIAASILLTHQLTGALPGMFLALIDGTTLDVGTLFSIHTFLTGLIILPTSIGLGAVMPLAMRAYVGGLDAVGRDVGRAYAANTVGAILGAVAGGFFVLPFIGLERGIRISAILLAVTAATLAWRSGLRRRSTALAFAGLVSAAALLLPGWNRSDFTAGLFRTHLARSYLERGGLFEREVVYYRDGTSTTVSVERLAGGLYTLKNNGKVEASDRHDMPTQILVGLLPVLLHGDVDQDVFVVGYGSGVTVGAIAQAPQVSRIDVVELEPAVYEAADRYFGHVNHRPELEPRVRRHVGDGRSFLLSGGRSYDVIVSEPSNPWIAGVASLFTRDFYEFAAEHLAEDGIFCQWAQLYELGPRNVKMIYRTFASTFPYVYAFTPGDETTDTILIGSRRPIPLDFTALAAAMRASPELQAELERARVRGPDDLLGSLFLGPAEVAAFTAGAEINTDDNARLEYSAPRDLLASGRGNHFARAVRGENWPYGRLEGLVTGLGDGAARPAAKLRLARALLGYGRLREASTWTELARAAGASEGEAATLSQLLELVRPVDFLDPELSVAAGGDKLAAPSPELFRGDEDTRRAAAGSLAAAHALLAEARFPAAFKQLEELPARADDAGGRDVTLLAAYAGYKSLELPRARELLRELAGDPDYVARRPAVLYYLGRAEFGLGAFQEGVSLLEEFQKTRPELAEEVLGRRLRPSR
jgi:spermidine synthase